MVDQQDADPTTVREFAIPKYRSTVNLQAQGVAAQGFGRRRRSASSAESNEYGSPHDHDHGSTNSGLYRIRPQPPSRLSSYGPKSATDKHSRPAPMTINLPRRPTLTTADSSGPATPLTPGEYLTRFPAESLHSFSFSQKQDDPIHTRQTLLKRSMEFMRDRMSWSAGGIGLASVQARAGGDQDMLGMMDLISRANVLSKERVQALGLGLTLGPVTGPAYLSGENIFEREFMQSPTGLQPGNQFDGATETGTQTITAQSRRMSRDGEQDVARFSLEAVHEGSAILDSPPISSPPKATRLPQADLKRTFTDVSALSLRNKLAEALDESYMPEEPSLSLLRSLSTNSPAFPPSAGGGFTNPVPHAHGRAAPNNQAIFTTQVEHPWIINAANDVACLTFGVTKAELRKIGILDLVREDKRKWLEQKLKSARAALAVTPLKPSTPVTSLRSSSTPSPQRLASPSALGSGVTARLLSKPPSRETGRRRKAQTQPAVEPELAPIQPEAALTEASFTNGKGLILDTPKSTPPTPKKKHRGTVLLCGDVVSILKRNGASGSATLWVQEKRGALIWVMEEIAEDVAYLTVDEVGCIVKAGGSSEAVWGMERVRRGMDITRLIPNIPRRQLTNTGALDYEKIAELRRFTARTANDISVPVTVDQISGESAFRVSSFPHMAGMMVLSASTLTIKSSNAPISEALFGRLANGCPITDLIPEFDKMLEYLVEEDGLDLEEGVVVTEYSFRRARANLALRNGRPNAAGLVLRSAGLSAIHRDGADIMIDAQMRVVKSNSLAESENAIEPFSSATSAADLVYALWITYSRTEHAMSQGVGPVPAPSRPGTPPQQVRPSNSAVAMHIEDSDSDEARTPIDHRRMSVMTPIPEGRDSPRPHPPPTPTRKIDSTPTLAAPIPRKTINDFVILEDMGAGAYGQVKLARPKTQRDTSPYNHSSPSPSRSPSASLNNNKVVIKYVTKSRILVDTWYRDRRLGTVPLEIHVLSHLRSPSLLHSNIVEMIDFFEDSSNYYILMKPHGLPGMDLFDYIELRTNMAEEECRRIFVQVAGAVEWLHERARVVHRDIKDENIILDGEGRCKVIDFGSASYIKNGPFDVFVGTIDYAAPEVLAGRPYLGPAQDVWALGILLYTILYKENPFYSIDEILDHELRVPYVVSEESIELVRGMLERDVDRRRGIKEVTGDVWCREA